MKAAGRESGPVVYLLVGLTGSGKTTYARRRLESAGAARLSVDERVHARHGRYRVDYPERQVPRLKKVPRLPTPADGNPGKPGGPAPPR